MKNHFHAKSSGSTDHNVLFYSKIVPLGANYQDYLLPEEHPWYPKVQENITELKSLYRYHQGHAPYKMLVSLSSCMSHFHFYRGELGSDFVVGEKGSKFVIKRQESNHKNDQHGHLKRILVAHRLKKVIQDYQLDKLYIPSKYLYPWRSNAQLSPPISTHFVVISEKIHGQLKPFDSKGWKQLKKREQKKILCQLLFLMNKTGFMDISEDNIKLMPNGCLAIIDTDEFPAPAQHFKLLLRHPQDPNGQLRNWEIHHCCLKGLIRESNSALLQFPNQVSKYQRVLRQEYLQNKIFKCANELLAETPLFELKQMSDQQWREIRYQNMVKRCSGFLRAGIQK